MRQLSRNSTFCNRCLAPMQLCLLATNQVGCHRGRTVFCLAALCASAGARLAGIQEHCQSH